MNFLDFLIFTKICLSDDIQGFRCEQLLNKPQTEWNLPDTRCSFKYVCNGTSSLKRFQQFSFSHSFVCCHGKENIFPPKCGECPAFRSSTLYCKIDLVCFLDHKSQTLTSSDGTGRYIQYYMLLRICLNIRSQFNFIFEIRAIYKAGSTVIVMTLEIPNNLYTTFRVLYSPLYQAAM